MKTIDKYSFEPDDPLIIEMPRGAEIIHVGMQHGRPRVWAKVDTDQPLVPHKFRLVGTGHELPDDAMEHLATFGMEGSMLIFHLFTQRY